MYPRSSVRTWIAFRYSDLVLRKPGVGALGHHARKLVSPARAEEMGEQDEQKAGVDDLRRDAKKKVSARPLPLTAWMLQTSVLIVSSASPARAAKNHHVYRGCRTRSC